MYDEGSYQIKKIDSKGVVTNFLGQAYNGGSEQEGSADDVRVSIYGSWGQICLLIFQMEIYTGLLGEVTIWKYDASANSG